MGPEAVELAVRGHRVVTPEGMRPAAVLIARGVIAEVVDPGAVPRGCAVIDAGDSVVMAGLVDTHVHVNEPGRTDWEGFETATRAAAAGGITTIADMPLNSVPVTTTAAALDKKLAAARPGLFVDCAFWGGLVPENADELEPLLDAGVVGVKAFMIDSGIDEFPSVGERELERAMPVLARRGAPLLAHAELATGAACATSHSPAQYQSYLRSRPRAMENDAIRLLVALCRRHRCRVHVVHLSSADAVPEIAAARREGLPITVETCPHYLSFAAEEIADGATTFKCAPPIRERDNRERLWAALLEGAIDLVVSDHSPCPPALKRLDQGDFLGAWGGIASLELALAATWTGARARGATPVELGRWMCARPAELAGLQARKGSLAPGRDADLVVWNPEATFTVDPARLHQRHPLTPYAGRALHGVVERTVLRGVTIFERGSLTREPRGMTLLRK